MSTRTAGLEMLLLVDLDLNAIMLIASDAVNSAVNLINLTYIIIIIPKKLLN